MAGAFHHHLHAGVAGALHEPAERMQLGELRGVGSVVQAARAQAVAERVGDVVLPHDGADLVEQVVHRVLLAVVDHPLRQQRAAARHDAGHPRCDQRQVLAQHAGVDGEVIDALLRLALDLLQDEVVAQIFDAPTEDHAVDRHRADRHRAVVDDGLAAFGQTAAGGEVHDGVGPIALCPAQFLHLFRRAAAHR